MMNKIQYDNPCGIFVPFSFRLSEFWGGNWRIVWLTTDSFSCIYHANTDSPWGYFGINFFFFGKLVRLNSSALRACWLPPKRNNYKFPFKSIIWSISSIQSCLHHKSRDTIQCHLTLWMKLDLSSKHLPFLSFQTDHHTHDGISFHHLFWLLLPPLLIQQLNKSDVCSGIVQFMLVMLRNKFQIWAVNLQCNPGSFPCEVAQKST